MELFQKLMLVIAGLFAGYGVISAFAYSVKKIMDMRTKAMEKLYPGRKFEIPIKNNLNNDPFISRNYYDIVVQSEIIDESMSMDQVTKWFDVKFIIIDKWDDNKQIATINKHMKEEHLSHMTQYHSIIHTLSYIDDDGSIKNAMEGYIKSKK